MNRCSYSSAAMLLAVTLLLSSAKAYPTEVLPHSNTTLFAMERLGTGGLYIVALGVDHQLWHIFQEDPANNGTLVWGDWEPLTSVCPGWDGEPSVGVNMTRTCYFDSDPTIGRNSDGTLEIFARFHTNLDLWQLYQTNASDPRAWSTPREPSCVDQSQVSGDWFCLGGNGTDPRKQTTDHYYMIDSPVFPTSDVTILNDAKDGSLEVWYRNFEGHMFSFKQTKAGTPSKYDLPILMGDPVMV